jgi:hypothetical protein
MRQIIGTTAQWAANDLVIGKGEIAIEDAGGVIKAKVGDGIRVYSALPYAFGGLDTSAGDARYVLLTSVAGAGGAGAANKIPRLGSDGTIPRSFLQTISTLANPAAAGANRFVLTSSSGMIDPSLVNFPQALILKGGIDPTKFPSPQNPAVGDTYIANTAGIVDGSYPGAAGQMASVGDLLVYANGAWSLIPSGAGVTAFLPLTGGTVIGDTTFEANLIVGNNDADKLILLARVSGNVVPDTGSTYDIGTSALTWANVFADRFHLADGNAAQPSLAFISSAGTGIFYPDKDSFAISTAGAERLHITESGLVGINTNNPLTPLHVEGVLGVGNGGALHFNHDGTNGSTNNTKGDYLFFTPDAHSYVWHVGGNAVAKIDGFGNFGIGTPTPTARLEVVGPTAAKGSVRVNDGTITLFNGATGADANRAGFEVATRRLPMRTTPTPDQVTPADSGGGILASADIAVTAQTKGDLVSLFNMTDSPIVLNSSGVSMFLAGDAGGPKTTLTMAGRAAATLSYVADNTVYVSGQGVS